VQIPITIKLRYAALRAAPNRKIDGFLKVLGVNHVIYKDELQNSAKGAINHVKSIFDPTLTDLLVNASF